MAAECVTAQENRVSGQDQSSYADAKSVLKPHGLPGVVSQKHDENQCEVEEVAMYVLKDKRKGSLAEIFLAGLAHRAGWRIGPKRLVVCAAIVVAGDSESTRRPQDQHRASDPEWHPVRHAPQPGVLSGDTEYFRRIHRREVRP